MCGCSNMDFTFVEYADGSYREIYTVTFSETEFKQIGASDTEIQQLKNHLTQRLTSMAGTNLYLGSFESEFYGRVDSSEQNEIKRNELKRGFNCEMQEQGDTYQLIFNYADIEVYRNFHQITKEQIEESKDDIVIEKKFLTYKIIQPGITRFGVTVTRSDETTTSLGNYLWEQTQIKLVEILGSEKAQLVTKPSFTYSYATSSHRLHSDADRVYESMGFYFHIWTLENGDETREITFHTVEARREVWYALIAGATVVFILFLAVCNKIKGKKEKKANQPEVAQEEKVE